MFRDDNGFPNPENPNNQGNINNSEDVNQGYNYNNQQDNQNYGYNYNQQGQNNGYVPNPNYPQDNQGQNSGYQYPQQPTFTPYPDNTQPNYMSNFNNTQSNIPPSNDLSQYSKKKKNKKKKKGGCLWSLLKFIIIFWLIIGIIVGIIFGINYFNNQKEIKELEASIPKMSTEEILLLQEEKLKSEQSDIEGLSKWDKLEKGLSVGDNSDTDGDGLTDKEEIEVYKTDPLKVSSSGDTIPDGVKVKNSMELTKKYSSKEANNYGAFSKYETVKLKENSTENSLANIYEIENYKVSGVETVKNYAITNYSGKVDLDFSKEIEGLTGYVIVKEFGETNVEYEVLEDKKGKVTVSIKDGETVVVSLLKIENNNLNFFDSLDYENESIEGNNAYLVLSPISLITGQLHTYLWEASLFGGDNSERSEVVKSYLANALNCEIAMNHFYVNPVEVEIISKIFDSILGGTMYKSMLSEQGVEVSDEDVSFFTKALQFFVIGVKLDKGNWGEVLENPAENVEEEVKEKPSKYMSTFNVAKDALPFPNVGTYISPGGNCTGFTVITAKLFNSNSNKRSGEYNDDEYGLMSYDINNDDFNTFFDKHLDDYKNRTYWTEKYKDMDTLPYEKYEGTDGDFIKFLGYHWRQGNVKSSPQVKMFNDEYKWSDFEKLQDYFASGDNVACLSMSTAGSGHSVLCYGLSQDANNPNVWYMHVYDNNFPNHLFNGKYRATNKVKVTKCEPLFGEDYFEWTYYPLPDKLPNYKYTSRGVGLKFDSGSNFLVTALQAHIMSVYDENYNQIF